MATYRDLPDHSRVWIYQSNRVFNKDELVEIKQHSNNFLADWNSHGKDLKAAIEIFYDLFVVVLVDEVAAAASGCSIDSSFQFIKKLEETFAISLLDRLTVAHRDDDGICLSRIDQFEALIHEGGVNGDTIVFNNLVDTKADFDTMWEVLLKDSWHRKLLD
ncbi:MAG: ABC transporter ATPase [Flavobacteriales bacterium]|nr:ABC transporter ATPase [Flavobacteriales bacterium]MBL4736151.1 ABC transporter ATPase [Flavobacteriales bacterium]